MDEKCPKCGGEMKAGEIRFDSDTVMPSQMNSYMTGIPNSPLPNVYQSSTSRPYWEERTGRRTGFIIKSEEKLRLKVTGLRCALCGYIELYATQKRDED
jgi:predicted nucleic-acid-binding Zn-ribbon protein